MRNFEKIIEDRGHLGEAKAAELASTQRNISRVDEKSLVKEMKENSIGKASMLELLTDRLVGQLSLPENYKIIDEAVGEEGASQELADRLWKYSEKLGAKTISLNNSVRDVLGNLEATLMGFVKRAQKKGLEKYKEEIAGLFKNVKDYVSLLENENYARFEKDELGSQLGFLSGKMKKEKLESLKLDKSGYIEECRKRLESG